MKYLKSIFKKNKSLKELEYINGLNNLLYHKLKNFQFNADIKYFEDVNNLQLSLIIRDDIIKGTKSDNFKEFRKFLDFLDKYSDFTIYTNPNLKFSIIFYNNIEKVLEDFESEKIAKKYNL